MAGVIPRNPVGWWLSYKEDYWCGPYETEEEAHAEARYLVPASYETYQLLQVQRWDHRLAKNTKFIKRGG